MSNSIQPSCVHLNLYWRSSFLFLILSMAFFIFEILNPCVPVDVILRTRYTDHSKAHELFRCIVWAYEYSVSTLLWGSYRLEPSIDTLFWHFYSNTRGNWFPQEGYLFHTARTISRAKDLILEVALYFQPTIENGLVDRCSKVLVLIWIAHRWVTGPIRSMCLDTGQLASYTQTADQIIVGPESLLISSTFYTCVNVLYLTVNHNGHLQR